MTKRECTILGCGLLILAIVIDVAWVETGHVRTILTQVVCGCLACIGSSVIGGTVRETG